MPYFPPGREALPPTRFVLFSDEFHKVRVIDESEVLRNQGSFDSWWLSPTLNRRDPFKLYTLRKLLLFYDAEGATTITVQASGDGGATFNQTKTVSVEQGDDKVAVVGFNTTGHDLRFRIDLDTDILVSINGYKYRAVERSEIAP